MSRKKVWRELGESANTHVMQDCHQECSIPHAMLLLRFDQPHWLQRIYDTETLRFVTISRWREIENDGARGDKWEGATSVFQLDKMRVSLRPSDEPAAPWTQLDLASPVIIRNPDDIKHRATHAFCFPVLTCGIINSESAVDLSAFPAAFGPSLFAGGDVDKFISLWISAFRSHAPRCDNFGYGGVTYVSETYGGDYSIYRKPDRFAWQKEFRLTRSCRELADQDVNLHVAGLAGACCLMPQPQLSVRVTRSLSGAHIEFI